MYISMNFSTYIETWNHHCWSEQFYHPPNSLVLLIYKLLAVHWSVLCHYDFIFSRTSYNFCYVTCYSSEMLLRFIQIVPCLDNLLLFAAEEYFIVWLYHSLFIHSLTEGYFSYSQFGQLWIQLLEASEYKISLG